MTLPVALARMALVPPPKTVVDISSATLPTTKINPKDGAEMVLIPAGAFLMGDDDMTDVGNPRRKVNLGAYYIYKNLVTVAMYEKFCVATGRAMPPEPSSHKDIHFNPNWSKKEHPMIDLKWEDAKAYCDWAGVSLPSEAQWEKAARGTDGRKYPWGNEFDASKLWCSKFEYGEAGSTSRVGSISAGASPYGVLDMAGNAWQWCEEWYDPSETAKVIRGGSWFQSAFFTKEFRSSFRYKFGPTDWRYSGCRAVSPELR